ncbi:type I-E CRISPR-associated protein Cas5/CasD [Schaalia vaccimaxillae]|uniref:type I-E CRISPR-associated protein Cas5/CasD n=1 Tax=Schaalia vaccimaxillae TaxID=183916 RepID=UPI0003B3FE0A|nr:type I-E CRISPR-associated protein Cas5/CasD [Schaalia vaccimaxillae]
MSVLLLRLAGPLQAWGCSSRFTVRGTETAPTKSGVIGMLAAAQGRRRTAPIEDLMALSFGVRKDQPGPVLRDFHTARTLDGKTSMPLSQRYYLSDTVFLAGIEGDYSLLEGLSEALCRPVFPLYLGRRSCPPTQPVTLGIRERSLFEALRDEPWQASDWFRRRHRGIDSEILIDQEAVPVADRNGFSNGNNDVPHSFDPRRREYGFRQVERITLHLGASIGEDTHDPMEELEEAARCS